MLKESDIVFEETENLFLVSTPYYPAFRYQMKKNGWKWDGQSKMWMVPKEEKENAIYEVYMTFGRTDEPYRSITITTLNYGSKDPVVWGYGQKLLWRPASHLPVETAENVEIVAGEFPGMVDGQNKIGLPIGESVTLFVKDIPMRFMEYPNFTGRVVENELL